MAGDFKYGYVGTEEPAQSTSSNSGVFSQNEIVDLRGDNEYTVLAFEVEYLVVAGGAGGGGSGYDAYRNGAGGGAGGYRSSVGTENTGGGLTTEAKHLTLPGTNYAVTIGSGAGANSSNGSDTSFSTITSLGGGYAGYGNSNGRAGGDGGSGGGAKSQGNSNNQVQYDHGDGTAGQGYDGGNGWYEAYNNSYNEGGGGGGAAQTGENGGFNATADGGDGVESSISGTGVYYSGGGACHKGTNGLGGGNSASRSANTGGGGKADSGAGGSGKVCLRYDSLYTVTNPGGGLTLGTETTVGSDKYIEITAGSGDIQWNVA